MDKILCQLCDYKDSPDCPHNSNICHSFRSEDKDCLRIVAKTAHLVAQEIFKELEEEFGLYTDWEGKTELSMIVVKPGDYYSTEDALEKYTAFKKRWGVE